MKTGLRNPLAINFLAWCDLQLNSANENVLRPGKLLYLKFILDYAACKKYKYKRSIMYSKIAKLLIALSIVRILGNMLGIYRILK